jgi:PAS domain S-box-containing protein
MFAETLPARTIGVVSTNPARCRDCYRCVRVCPVKAVRVAGGQAEVVPELCIACGSCVRACPQHAKVTRDDLPAVKAALRAGRTVVATVAPSVAAFFPVDGAPEQGLLSLDPLTEALTALGFAAVAETAVGAAMVGLDHGEYTHAHPDRWPVISSSCPVIINLVEQCYPDLIPHLAPQVSPMIAHGRYLHSQHGEDAFVVFVGPCIAKKAEATEAAVAGAIDAVLTFDELARWMADAGVTLCSISDVSGACPNPSDFEATSQLAVPAALAAAGTQARLFPLEGGLLGTARLSTDLLSTAVFVGSGMDLCRNVLEGIRAGGWQTAIVELMACSGGCINGPALEERGSIALSRQRVQVYAEHRGPQAPPPRAQWPELARTYRDRSIPEPQFTEAEISAVLHQVGKYLPEDELNCGSCGYASCREKAIATLRGMAEATMCIPYMRARTESLHSVVMDVTPNAILVVDGDLRVQDLSRSAEEMFGCSRVYARGKPIQHLLPVVDDFINVRDTGRPVLNKVVRFARVGSSGGEVVVEETVVPVTGPSAARDQVDRNLLVAILRDVTAREQEERELERMRAETVRRTQEVISKQMRVAHEIAGLLGETTAETKVVLTQLTRLLAGGDNPGSTR